MEILSGSLLHHGVPIALLYHRIVASGEVNIALNVPGMYIVRQRNNTVKMVFE
jgi:hypothetical protein